MIPCELSRRLGRITRESECPSTPIHCPSMLFCCCIPERLEQYKTKGATNEKFDEAYASNTRNLSVLLHRFLAVYVRCTFSAEQRGTHPEYCSGAWSLGRWLRLERRIQHSCQGRLQRQHRPRTGDVLPRRCGRSEACPRAARRPEHPCRAQLWRSRNYGSWLGSIGCRIGVRGGTHARRWRERVRGRKALPERPRQIGRHKENARRVHIYRPDAIS